VNPDYQGTYVFNNDFCRFNAGQSLMHQKSDNPLFQAMGVRGLSRVICFFTGSQQKPCLN
jgi:UDPglucose--hexose-1-phosphate uridylyltransferase